MSIDDLRRVLFPGDYPRCACGKTTYCEECGSRVMRTSQMLGGRNDILLSKNVESEQMPMEMSNQLQLAKSVEDHRIAEQAMNLLESGGNSIVSIVFMMTEHEGISLISVPKGSDAETVNLFSQMQKLLIRDVLTPAVLDALEALARKVEGQ